MKRVLIMGASSAIAEAAARRMAERGDALFLVARNAERLAAVADDLKLRGAAQVASATLDARRIEDYARLIDTARESLDGLDAALIAHGRLTDQGACEADPRLLVEEFEVNAVSAMALSLHLANHFAAQRHGVIAVISSVAGDRGRQSNYIYGAGKAALSAFLSGLGQKLHPKGVSVVTIKPGFVISPMTAAFKHGALWATPDAVARDIVRAMDRGTAVLYTPWFWRAIMAVIRAVPERVFRRMRL
jgi:decaprenylphospho-beta-D-erythro-pentofuranosid-2-ulose 2-reductase